MIFNPLDISFFLNTLNYCCLLQCVNKIYWLYFSLVSHHYTNTESQISGCVQAHSDLYRSIDHLWLDHSGWMFTPGLSCDLVMLKPLPFIPPTVILWCSITLSLQKLESQQVLTLQPWGRSRSKPCSPEEEEDFLTDRQTHHNCPYLKKCWTMKPR